MSSLPTTSITVEEYFALDDASSVKLEFDRGHVYAMAGALEPHNVISGNAFFQLKLQLRGTGCRVYQGDQRVRTGDGMFTYPDVSVACEPQFLETSRRTLLNPSVLIEVLSDSTELYDRTGKFERYGSMESLREYLLISSNRKHADLYARQPGGKWVLSSASDPHDSIEFASCGCRLKLSEIYEDVELPAAPPSLRVVGEPGSKV